MKNTIATNDEGFIYRLLQSLLKPGVTSDLIKFMNYTFIALIGLIAVFLISGENSIHLWVFLGLSVGLFASINWYYVLLLIIKY